MHYLYLCMGLNMRIKVDFNLVAMALAAVVIIEGLAIAANAHPIRVEGFGGMKGSTVMLAGLQMAIIGAGLLVSLWWNEHVQMNNMIDTVAKYMTPLAGAALLLEGLTVAYFAAPIYVPDIGGIRNFYISAFGAQLFFIGAGIVILWLFRTRLSTGLLLSLGAFLMIATAGIMVMSAADHISWVGLGGFKQSTVLIAGTMLALIGLLGIVLYYVEGRSILGREILGMELWSWGIMALGLIIAIGAAVVISLAGHVIFPDRLSFKESTVALAGMGMFILGLLSFTSPSLLRDGIKSMPMVPVMACMFALLLVPFALLV